MCCVSLWGWWNNMRYTDALCSWGPPSFRSGDHWPSGVIVSTNDEINRWCHSLHILATVHCDSGSCWVIGLTTQSFSPLLTLKQRLFFKTLPQKRKKKHNLVTLWCNYTDSSLTPLLYLYFSLHSHRQIGMIEDGTVHFIFYYYAQHFPNR